MVPWPHGNMAPWYHEAIVPLCHDTMVPDHGTRRGIMRIGEKTRCSCCEGVNPPRLDAVVLLRPLVTFWHWAYPWYQGAKLPWYHGTMVPWCHGAMVPWYHGTMLPWHHGNMVPWGRNARSFSPDVGRPILVRESRFWGILWGDPHHFSSYIFSD